MCGRFARFSPAHVFRMLFQLEEFTDLPPQYNISPGQDIYAVRGITVREEQKRNATANTGTNTSVSKEVAALKWGLIPFWSKEPKSGPINARSETVFEKASFKASIKKRRCLIPADGFYEWQKKPVGPKQPFYIHMVDKKPFALAGIWDKWKDSSGEVIESCSILTTEPNEIVKPIHKRMPVIIEPKKFDTYLEVSKPDLDEIKALLKPFDARKMEAYPVSLFVNKPENKGEKCIQEEKQKYKQQKLF